MSGHTGSYAAAGGSGNAIHRAEGKASKSSHMRFCFRCLAPFDKLLHKSNHSSWPLHSELEGFLESLPPEAIEEAYADTTFVGLYGKSERLARVWITERFLIEESARRRLESLAEPLLPSRMPYTADCLQKIKIDGECMVRLADLAYNNATLAAGEFSFTVCSTTESPNSTYWLLRSFYEQGVAGHVSVRLDPFLWGPSDSFPQTMYKMLVYAAPVNWESMSKLRLPPMERCKRTNQRTKANSRNSAGIPGTNRNSLHLRRAPPRERIEFTGARYLHAIYDPTSQSITHFDGALRIYTGQELEKRHAVHIRKAGRRGAKKGLQD